MKESDKILVSEFLYLESITEEQFLRDYSGNLSEGTQHFEELLNEAILLQDSYELEDALAIGAYFKLWNLDLIPTFNTLLLEDWHFQHENIVLSLQAAKDPRSIEAIYLTAQKEFAYLDYDDTFGLARKCTWALADINTPESVEKLRSLAESENEIIRSYANERL